MLATNLASKVCNSIRLCNISKALFITIAPPPCSKLLSAACSLRINILRPSNPLRYPRLAALDTRSLRTLSDGLLSRKRCLSSDPSFLPPPTTLPIFASPAPYINA